MADTFARAAVILMTCAVLIFFSYQPLFQVVEDLAAPAGTPVVYESLLKGFR